MTEAGKTRLLVIDDDRKLGRLIRDYLEPIVLVQPELLFRALAEGL